MTRKAKGPGETRALRFGEIPLWIDHHRAVVLARCEVLHGQRTPRQGVVESQLTPREQEVLEMLATGLPPDQIARKLSISPKTVGTHIQRILTKLGVHSRTEAVAIAYRSGLVDSYAG